jgi:hypothetical protein
MNRIYKIHQVMKLLQSEILSLLPVCFQEDNRTEFTCYVA